MKRLALSASVFALASALWLGTVTPASAAESAPVNSQRALSQTIHELNADGQSLVKIFNFLRDVSGANLVVNWTVLEQAGISKDTTVSLNVREVPLRKVLQLVLNQASPNVALTYSVDANVIQVTSQEVLDRQLITKVYIVDDLVMVTNNNVQPPQINLQAITGNTGTQSFQSGQSGGGGGGGFGGGGGGGGGFGGGGGGGGGAGGGGLFTQSTTNTNQNRQTSEEKGQELVTLIKEIVRPEIWSDSAAGSGRASIRYFNGKLIVTAPVSVHEAIGGAVADSATGVRFGM